MQRENKMAQDKRKIEVSLETGQKKTFASALDWPGWCRSGRDEASALQTLFEYGPRYARAIEPAQIGFQIPSGVSELVVVERVKGDTTTEFGTPGRVLARDSRPVEAGELERWVAAVKACWQAFDAAVRAATGKTLSKG